MNASLYVLSQGLKKKMPELLDVLGDAILHELAVEFQRKEYGALKTVMKIELSLKESISRCEVCWLGDKKEMSCSINRTTGSFCIWREDVLCIQFLSSNRHFHDLLVFSVIVTEKNETKLEDECYIRFDTYDDKECVVNIMASMPNEQSDTSPHTCSLLVESLCSNLGEFALDGDHCFEATAARPAHRDLERSVPTE